MKIGIVTFHAARNYGAALQAYALQTHLKNCAHEPFFINYQGKWDPPLGRGLRGWFSRTPQGTIAKMSDRFRRPVFLEFQERHLHIGSHRYLAIRELQSAPPAADAYICGSDQIWNPAIGCQGTDEHVSWLDFGNEGIRRVAYAASCCVSHLDRDVRARWAAYARRFHAVSVREKDAVDLMKTLGRADAVWVPDPTLLLDDSAYASIQPKAPRPDCPFVFCYVLPGDNATLASRVTAIARSVLGVDCCESRPHSLIHNLCRGGPLTLSPGEWLDRLRRSCFVVTNSFHALAFSLIYRRPFVVLLRAGMTHEKNSRITSLLSVAGLEDRAVATFDRAQVERLCCQEIKWDQVHARLTRFREIGCRFLHDALS